MDMMDSIDKRQLVRQISHPATQFAAPDATVHYVHYVHTL
jgi:hypothetical protein